MLTFRKLQALIEERTAEADRFPPPSEAQIGEAEATLGVKFPRSYRWFLLTYGAMSGAEDIYGVSHNLPDYLSLVQNVLAERTQFEPHIPHSLIPVSPDGSGNHYCIDTARMVKGEAPIIFWDHESDNTDLETTHATFADFLEEILQEESDSE
jgi:cell wall assembly regulator SMI1